MLQAKEFSVQTEYQLGNPLRGWYHGTFEDDQTAWDTLSEQFNTQFPSKTGREVILLKCVRVGLTKGGNETEIQRHMREQLSKLDKDTITY